MAGLFYSSRERFGWLRNAALLEQIATAEKKPRNKHNYRAVAESRESAWSIATHLSLGELSSYALDRPFGSAGNLTMGKLRFNLNDLALNEVRRTGNVDGRIVKAAIAEAHLKNDHSFFRNLNVAKRTFQTHQPPILDPWDAYLVNYWCVGQGLTTLSFLLRLISEPEFGRWNKNGMHEWKVFHRVFVAPPLSFFSDKSLITFCELLNPSLGAIGDSKLRKHLSRLRLVKASKPRIRDSKLGDDGSIYFSF